MAFQHSDFRRCYLEGTFQHISHIGRSRSRCLQQAGIDCWGKVPEQCPENLPGFQHIWPEFRREIRQSEELLQQNRLDFFLEHLPYSERWRLLADCWEKVVYLDIETSAVDYTSTVTTISCWDGRKLRLFFQGENLDEFLDYADSVSVFATFNGASFDLPQLCRCFHVPELFPGIHLDLRWMFRDLGWTGGLKLIEKEKGIQRPEDIVETRGDEAIELWDEWQVTGKQDARRKLLRYCAADTITLRQLAALFLQAHGCPQELFSVSPEEDWQALDLLWPPVYECCPQRKNPPLIPAQAPAAAVPETRENRPADPEFQRMQSRLKRFLERKREN